MVGAGMDAREVWRQTLARLESSMNPANFDTWLRPTRVIGEEDGAILIGCPTTYVKEWLETRLLPSIKKSMNEVGAAPVEIRFRVADTFTPPRPRTRLPGGSAAELGGGGNGFTQRYTFENFVVGPNNRFAHAAAMAVAERPGQVYVPLFIYGGVGLGKTHLLYAIGNRCRTYFPNARVSYTTYERFMNDLIKALREGRQKPFEGPIVPSTCCWWTTSSSSPGRSKRRKSSSTPSMRSTEPASRSSSPRTGHPR